MTGGRRRSGAERAAQIARDTGPSAALSRDGAHAYAAPPATPCGRTSLTRSRAAKQPIRTTIPHREAR